MKRVEQKAVLSLGRRRPRRRLVAIVVPMGVAVFLLLGIILPRTSRITFRTFRWERPTRLCALEIATVVAALRQYRKDHGSLPSSLAELVPQYVQEVPRCPEDFVEGRPSFLYGGPDVQPQDVPLLSCERHWEAGLNIFVSYDLQAEAVWKVPGWMPGDQLSSSDGQVPDCKRNLAMIADAIQKYRDEKGTLPHNLAELVPSWIEGLPHCRADFAKTRPSYLYWPLLGAAADAPLVTCERHWPAGIDLYVTNALDVKARPKDHVNDARALSRKYTRQVEDERDALMQGSLPYVLKVWQPD